MTHYDLLILGSGSGNSLITPYWDNKKVAIIDGGIFGGTCLNVGCIPTKMFVYPAQLADSTEEAQRLGVDLEFKGARWEEIRDRIFGRIDAISEGGRKYRDIELDNVDLYAEYVKFTSTKSMITASGKEITADQVVIAAGSRATLPEIPGIDLPQVHTSDTIMRVDFPQRIVVVGSGFIAAEFANIFHSLGSTVTQLSRSGQLLRAHDPLVSERFTQQAKKRCDVRQATPTAIESATDGGVVVITAENSGTEAQRIEADVVLFATGRVSNVDRLDPETAGFDVKDGVLSVDEFQRVLSNGQPLQGVYGLGDVSNSYQLKHVANREARVVIHNLEHPDELRETDYRAVPAAVFTHPQVANVGLTEPQAQELAAAENWPEGELAIAVQDYGSTAYGWAMEDQTGFVKLLARRSTGEILGAHIMGHEASNLIQPLVQAMVFGTDAHTLARAPYWIHPALMEVVENALLSLGTRDSGVL